MRLGGQGEGAEDVSDLAGDVGGSEVDDGVEGVGVVVGRDEEGSVDSGGFADGPGGVEALAAGDVEQAGGDELEVGEAAAECADEVALEVLERAVERAFGR